jgi:uncharacterized integral membrane protein (TIGR00698 family)
MGTWAKLGTRPLLQACVVLLGFSMDLPTVLRLGLQGSLFAAVSIAATLWMGNWLGRRFHLEGRTSVLLSAGTAICGGSAIAAVSSVIGADEAETAVSIGAVFLFNAAALYLFPLVGHGLGLSQSQFGLWAGVAIHDISSVVGAGMAYGPEALATATAVKLSRTLWIVPLTLYFAAAARRAVSASGGRTVGRPSGDAQRPWFIALFLLASLLRSLAPFVSNWSAQASWAAGKGMVIVLFLIGSSLSPASLQAVGWRALGMAGILWVTVSAASLAAIVLLTMK